MELKEDPQLRQLIIPAFKFSRPVEETVASHLFTDFVTIGATSDVPMFFNTAEAFDWWTKTLWYDCHDCLNTMRVKASQGRVFGEDFRNAMETAEDSIEFLKLFGTGWESVHKSIHQFCYFYSTYYNLLDCLMKDIQAVRQAGLRAGIVAAPIFYPIEPYTESKNGLKQGMQKPSFSPPLDAEEWIDYWWSEDFDETVSHSATPNENEPPLSQKQSKKKSKKKKLPPSKPSESEPGTKAGNYFQFNKLFCLSRIISESLAVASLATVPEFCFAVDLKAKSYAFYQCLDRLSQQCEKDLLDVQKRIERDMKSVRFKRTLLKHYRELQLVVFAFCNRNQLWEPPSNVTRMEIFKWFTRILPEIILGLEFLRTQFDREFPFFNWKTNLMRYPLLAYEQPAIVRVEKESSKADCSDFSSSGSEPTEIKGGAALGD